MRTLGRCLLGVCAIVALGAKAQMPVGEYLEGNASKIGVILAHG